MRFSVGIAAVVAGVALTATLLTAPAAPVPTAEKKDAAGSPARPPAEADPRKIAEWHKQAFEQMRAKDYAKAVATYGNILKARPDDVLALYNSACALALNGDKAGALERLRAAVENGFANFGHIARDGDLDSLRDEAAYKALFAQKDDYVRKARERAVDNIVQYLARQKIDAKAYKAVYDEERSFVYLHARPEGEFAEVRRGMEEFAESLWQMIFAHKPDQPLYIVLLTAQDTPKIMPAGVGGFFQREANILFCCERPASKLLNASIVFHEFTHGLHVADQTVLQQEHPIWITEGLSTLFESSRRENGRLTILPSFRLSVIQQAAKAGGTVPWETFVKLDNARFVGNASLCYAQARSMLFFLQEKGLLKAFYDKYTEAPVFARDKTGLDAFEEVFGKTAAEIERDWIAWALKQQVAAVPFLGVVADATGEVLKVRSVIPRSPAAVARIRQDDVIVSVEGTPTRTRDDLMEAVGNRNVGEQIEIRIEREGRPMDVTATLGERPELSGPHPGAPKPVPADRRAQQAPCAGFTVSGAGGDVFVREVGRESPAAKAGIESGWRILKYDKADIKTVRDFLAAVKKSKPGQTVTLAFRKPDGTDAAVTFGVDAVGSAQGE